ncbi:IS66 family transposase [Archangium lansingense]|uniref:IS66 family transposase n=1 Tax=Archangium lansingense TaxID=2995310 RepID=A0ABT4A1S6_9BACT|nr:IS66 family transposase [Archangium lansinium]MCY1074964.1 IS66 family transposase [Archangium lansinium]MCY1075645.1 IS66 family transposase [Archangium lansinium]MCY1077963.1 IS66 family transposase [Archangium lansinium]MCY1079584.1 IS66 family transposase [Archangium lansinium]MCY1079675.1 IS66 family transposase [Archangium lansinium]
MTFPVTIEEERGQQEEAQPTAFEADDMEAVRAYMLQLLMEGRGEQAVEMLLGLLGRLREEHSSTTVRLQQALRQLYGRRSEKTPASQLQLLLSLFTQQQSAEPEAVPATVDGAQAAAPAAPPADAPKKTPRRAPLRGAQALPAHLERREVLVQPAAEECVCPGCGEQRQPMGEEVSQRLELEPARFYVRVEKRPKLGCQRCKEGVAAAPAGEAPLPGALPGPGLLAQLLVGKYRDGLPLHRQQAIFDKRHGVRLPASTLGDWVAGASDLLAPVVALLKQRTLADALLHTDDTGVRVLDRDDARGIKRGHLWPYVGVGGNVFVEYTPDWSGTGPQGVLADFRGYLVVDGYKGYQSLFGPTSPRIEVGCWMHARRGFERAYVAGDARGGTVLTLVQKLYAVERQAQDAGLSAEARLCLRLEHSRPVYEELFGLLEEWAPHVPAKTPLGKAIAYARNRYLPLGRFLEDGRLPVDNGEVERLIKLIVLGRKNWLFLGSDAAGHRAASVYSLVLSCYRLGMDPWAYFRDVLPKLGDTRFPASRLAELLPESWAQQQAQQR